MTETVPVTNLVTTDCMPLYEAAKKIAGTADTLTGAGYACIVEILEANADKVTTSYAGLCALRAHTKANMRDKWADACTMHNADKDAGKVALSDANAAIVALAMGEDKLPSGAKCTSLKALAKIGRDILERLNPKADKEEEEEAEEVETAPAVDWEAVLRKVHAELSQIKTSATKAAILATVETITADIATALKA